MKINFDCRPFYEPSMEVVKFVGRHQDAQGQDQFVLCRVSREALEHLGQANTSDPDNLIEIFYSTKSKIYAIATAQYAVGTKRPLVTKEDVLKSLAETSVKSTKSEKSLDSRSPMV